MNTPYTAFARLYDRFMEDIPYEEWAGRIASLLKERGIEEGLVLDLGCGSGRLTTLLKQKGYDMIGVDASTEMLEAARERDPDILWLCQDMREFELYGTVKAIVSSFDSLNYITDPDDLKKVFTLAGNYLEERGVFIFDMNTPFKLEEQLGNAVFAQSDEDAAFICENEYDPETRINEYFLTLFSGREDGLFERNVEVHRERSYTLAEIKSLLDEAGLTFEAAFEGYLEREISEGEEFPGGGVDRMLIVARERHRDGKLYI